MPPSPPPIGHTGNNKPPTAASEVGGTLPAAVVEGTASKKDAITSTDGGTLQLKGKKFVEKIQALRVVPDYSSIICGMMPVLWLSYMMWMPSYPRLFLCTSKGLNLVHSSGGCADGALVLSLKNVHCQC